MRFAVSLLLLVAAASPAFASQGPGVGAGTAGPLAQVAASGIVGVMAAICGFALIKALRKRLH